MSLAAMALLCHTLSQHSVMATFADSVASTDGEVSVLETPSPTVVIPALGPAMTSRTESLSRAVRPSAVSDTALTG